MVLPKQQRANIGTVTVINTTDKGKRAKVGTEIVISKKCKNNIKHREIRITITNKIIV